MSGANLDAGPAQGVLTERLTTVCDTPLAVDISTHALTKVLHRVGDRPGLKLGKMAFPRDQPDADEFDLVVLSKVAYYWGVVDLDRASEWQNDAVVTDRRVMLVHRIGDTDYPQTGDGAVETLWEGISGHFHVETAHRTDKYRLDLWVHA